MTRPGSIFLLVGLFSLAVVEAQTVLVGRSTDSADCSLEVFSETPIFITVETAVPLPENCTGPGTVSVHTPAFRLEKDGTLFLEGGHSQSLQSSAQCRGELRGVDGTDGVTLIVDAAQISLQGTIVLGDGGAGQDLVVPAPCQSMRAIAGNGGQSARLLTTSKLLVDEALWVGGVGGRGGNVEFKESGSDEDAHRRGENGTVLEPDGESVEAVADAPIQSDGADGYQAFAYGGHGGPGALRGGAGGHALAVGSSGFRGANSFSGPAGMGGKGGCAFASGGHGGPSPNEGGHGGQATAIGGLGANGGNAVHASLGPGGQGGDGGCAFSYGGQGGVGGAIGGHGGDAYSISNHAGHGGDALNGTGGNGGSGGYAYVEAGKAGRINGTAQGGTWKGGSGGNATSWSGNGGNGGNGTAPGLGGSAGSANGLGGDGSSAVMFGGHGGNATGLGGKDGNVGGTIFHQVGNSTSSNSTSPADTPRKQTLLPPVLPIAALFLAAATRRLPH